MLALRRTDTGVRLDPDTPEPRPAPGEALIRTRLAAIAPADLHAAEGRAGFLGTLGHQFVGEVERVEPGPAVDPDRAKAWQGKRVVGQINVVPLDDPLARRGLGHHAGGRQVLGLRNRDGCVAERFTLPAINLAEVPGSVPDEHAVLAEPLAAAAHAAHLVRLEHKSYVTVIGDNLSALLCAQVMVHLNNSVRLLGERDDRLALCDRWRIRHRFAHDVGLRHDQDVVFECTGEPDNLRLAMGLVRPRGKIVLKTEPLPLPGEQTPQTDSHRQGLDLRAVVRDELELLGARCGQPSDALALLADGALDLSGIITARLPLADALAALELAQKPEHIKVVVEP